MTDYMEVKSIQLDRFRHAFKLNTYNGHSFYVFNIQPSDETAFHVHIDKCKGCIDMLRRQGHFLIGEALQLLGAPLIERIFIDNTVEEETGEEGITAKVHSNTRVVTAIVQQILPLVFAQMPQPTIYIDQALVDEQEALIAKEEAKMFEALNKMPEATRLLIKKAYETKQHEAIAPMQHTIEETKREVQKLRDHDKDECKGDCGTECANHDHDPKHKAKPTTKRGKDEYVG